MNPGVVILGAGASSRMGRPKLLLPWEGTTVIGHLLRQWHQVGAAQIAVVCADVNIALAGELERLGFPPASRIRNPQPERGMFSSIQCAAAWSSWRPDVTHWAITLGDQPQVRLETLQRLIKFATEHPGSICQPSHHGRGKHPVVMPLDAFLRVKGSQAANLKEFLSASGYLVARCEVNDPGLDIDLDEPADYERALALVNGPLSTDQTRLASR
jgi:molybdenum cofactor cytidylyltransferase